jgi:adenylylsulfate reductase subunit B
MGRQNKNMAAKIELKQCNGCGLCYDRCPQDVIAWDEDKDMPVVAYEEECWHCGICWMECPKRAIDIVYPVSFW